MELYTIFEIKYFSKYGWTTSVNFYLGDLSGIDLAADWRTKDVPNKRKDSRLVGLCYPEFPVFNKIQLVNGDWYNIPLTPSSLEEDYSE